MPETSSRQFGLIVAYLIPGFVGLAGVSPFLPIVGRWLQPVNQGELGLGPPIYALLGATAVGLIVSCFRWLFLDQLHHWTGVRRPEWDGSRLPKSLEGIDYLVQIHFRYYEFCGNTLVVGLWAYWLNRSMGTLSFLGAGTDLGMAIFALVLFAASRDALAKYYKGTSEMVGSVAEKELTGDVMFNGADHGHSGASAEKPKAEPKGDGKPQPTNKSAQTEVKGTQTAK